MSDVKRLMEDKAAIEKELAAMNENRVAENNRDFTVDELKSFDELDEKRSSLSSKIETQSRLARIGNDEKRSSSERVLIPTIERKVSKKTLESQFKAWALKSCGLQVPSEYRSAMLGNDTLNDKNIFVSTDPDEYRDEFRGDGIVASPYGANSVETLATARFELTKKAVGGLREFADVITTPGGNPIPFLYIDDVATLAAAKTKGADIGHADLIITKVTVSCSTVASGVYPIPKETLQDTSAKIMDRALEAVALRLYRKQNYDATVALLAAIEDAGDTASTTEITYNNLVDLQSSVDFGYNTRRAFCFHQSTLAHLKKMVNDNGDPIWNQGVAGGAPNTVLGEPYFINNDMPVLGGNDRKVIAYGDWSYFVIHEVNGVDLQALYELFAKQYAVGIMGTQRYGFGYVMPNTIKYLSTPSA